MTRKLTDEQVKNVSKISFDKDLKFYVESIDKHFTIAYSDKNSYNVYLDFQIFKKGLTKTELLVYLEGLLNAKYQWLPQNNGWIMSGEVYNFSNNGANKVLELMHLAYAGDWDEREDVWYTTESIWNGQTIITKQIGMPTSEQWRKGVTIYPESPIWDAVKGVE